MATSKSKKISVFSKMSIFIINTLKFLGFYDRINNREEYYGTF